MPRETSRRNPRQQVETGLSRLVGRILKQDPTEKLTWIENGKPTERRVPIATAFLNQEQAKEQIDAQKRKVLQELQRLERYKELYKALYDVRYRGKIMMHKGNPIF